MTIWTTTIETPVGELVAATSEVGLRALTWPDTAASIGDLDTATDAADLPVFVHLRAQLRDYFAGARRVFDLPLDPRGTPFQRLAWDALRQIPYGTTRTYREQAQIVGRPKAVRAIGAANGRNPLAIIVPCHRVIGSDGRLTGFAGGLDAKRYLLNLESAHRVDAAARSVAEGTSASVC